MSTIYGSDAVPIAGATSTIVPVNHYDDYWQLFQSDVRAAANLRSPILVQFAANTSTDDVTNSGQNAMGTYAHRALVALDDIELLSGTCQCPDNTIACSASQSQCVEKERVCDWQPDCLNTAGIRFQSHVSS